MIPVSDITKMSDTFLLNYKEFRKSELQKISFFCNNVAKITYLAVLIYL